MAKPSPYVNPTARRRTKSRRRLIWRLTSAVWRAVASAKRRRASVAHQRVVRAPPVKTPIVHKHVARLRRPAACAARCALATVEEARHALSIASRRKRCAAVERARTADAWRAASHVARTEQRTRCRRWSAVKKHCALTSTLTGARGTAA